MLVLVVLLVLLGTTCLLPAGVKANRKVSVNALLLLLLLRNSVRSAVHFLRYFLLEMFAKVFEVAGNKAQSYSMIK